MSSSFPNRPKLNPLPYVKKRSVAFPAPPRVSDGTSLIDAPTIGPADLPPLPHFTKPLPVRTSDESNPLAGSTAAGPPGCETEGGAATRPANGPVSLDAEDEPLAQTIVATVGLACSDAPTDLSIIVAVDPACLVYGPTTIRTDETEGLSDEPEHGAVDHQERPNAGLLPERSDTDAPRRRAVRFGFRAKKRHRAHALRNPCFSRIRAFTNPDFSEDTKMSPMLERPMPPAPQPLRSFSALSRLTRQLEIDHETPTLPARPHGDWWADTEEHDPYTTSYRESIEYETDATVAVPETPSENAMQSDRRGTITGRTRQMRVEGLFKKYRMGRTSVPVLKGVDLDVRQGEMLSIVGQSGCGKSTLLHLLGTLDVPDAGTIHFEERRIDNLPTAKRDVLRNREIGMIFQFYHLLPELTTLENVLAPLMVREGVLGYMLRRRGHIGAARALLERVGLAHRLKHRPSELSGGEMQRVSIARALIGDPKILLADEPTGNLDAASAGEILALLRELNRERNLTVVMVTHDPGIAAQADRTVRLRDGRVEV